jgi:molybdopterin molybdotransferase
MDGYAVRARDTVEAPTRLRVIAAVMAGHDFKLPVQSGQAVRIMTGAPIPAGANAACVGEETELDADGAHVIILRQLGDGDFVRPPGRDVSVGDVVAQTGTVLTPGHLGVLANQTAG